MLLEDLKVPSVSSAKLQPKKEGYKEALTEEEIALLMSEFKERTEGKRCGHCQTEGSEPLPNGTCDTCGYQWEEDEEEDEYDEQDMEVDLNHALELLERATDLLERTLKIQQVRGQIGRSVEDLLLETQEFLADWEL